VREIGNIHQDTIHRNSGFVDFTSLGTVTVAIVVGKMQKAIDECCEGKKKSEEMED